MTPHFTKFILGFSRAEMLSAIVHISIIILGVALALLSVYVNYYQNRENFETMYKDSKLSEALSSNNYSNLLVAAIFITIPMCLDLVLDVLRRVCWKESDGIPVPLHKCMKSWSIQLIILSSLALPAGKMLSLSNSDPAERCAWYICLTPIQFLVIGCATLTSLAKVGDPIWNVYRTIPAVLLYAIAWVFDVWCNQQGKKNLVSFVFIILLSAIPTLIFVICSLMGYWKLGQKFFSVSNEGLSGDDYCFVVYTATLIIVDVAAWIIPVFLGADTWQDTSYAVIMQYEATFMIITVAFTIVPTRIAKHDVVRAKIKLMTAEKFVAENLYNPLLFANNSLADLLQSVEVAALDMEKAMVLSRVASACHVAIRTLGQIDFSCDHTPDSDEEDTDSYGRSGVRRRRRAAEAKGVGPARGGSAEVRCAEDDDAAEIDDDGFGTGAAILRDLEEAGMAMIIPDYSREAHELNGDLFTLRGQEVKVPKDAIPWDREVSLAAATSMMRAKRAAFAECKQFQFLSERTGDEASSSSASGAYMNSSVYRPYSMSHPAFTMRMDGHGRDMSTLSSQSVASWGPVSKSALALMKQVNHDWAEERYGTEVPVGPLGLEATLIKLREIAYSPRCDYSLDSSQSAASTERSPPEVDDA